MSSREGLTDKQERVLTLLESGKTVQQIAKSMKIGTAGVYGHMRRIRAAGWTLPGEGIDDAHSGGATPASSNGAAEPDTARAAVIEALDTAQVAAREREAKLQEAIQKAEEIVKQATTEIGRLGDEAEEAGAAVRRYEQARQALVV